MIDLDTTDQMERVYTRDGEELDQWMMEDIYEEMDNPDSLVNRFLVHNRLKLDGSDLKYLRYNMITDWFREDYYGVRQIELGTRVGMKFFVMRDLYNQLVAGKGKMALTAFLMLYEEYLMILDYMEDDPYSEGDYPPMQFYNRYFSIGYYFAQGIWPPPGY